MPPEDLSDGGDRQSFSQLVADKVMAAIATRGMSMREMARLSGISLATLHGRLHNDHPFNTDELEAIAVAIGVTPSDLICG